MTLLGPAIVALGVILLLCALLLRGIRGSTSDAPDEEVLQRWGDENARWADGDSRLTQPPEPTTTPNEGVTPSTSNASQRSRCPACGAIITAKDERCPSCDICFVADGTSRWTPGAVGPADGIYLPTTEVSE